MMIFAHRGYSLEYLENTLTAFKKAFEEGADGIELDVRRSKDDELYVFHDDDMSRIFGVDKKVKDLSFEEIENFRNKGERIPSLGEVLDVIPEGRWVIVEIKEFEAGEMAVQLVVEKGLKNRAIFSSFDHDLIKELKYHHPNLNFAFLLDEEHKDIDPEVLIGYIIKTHPHSVHIPKDAFDILPELTLKFINIMKENCIDIFLWNTNDLEFVKKHAQLFDAVIIDDVKKFVSWKRGVKV